MAVNSSVVSYCPTPTAGTGASSSSLCLFVCLQISRPAARNNLPSFDFGVVPAGWRELRTVIRRRGADGGDNDNNVKVDGWMVLFSDAIRW